MTRRLLLRGVVLLPGLSPVRDIHIGTFAVASPATPNPVTGDELTGAVPVSMLIQNDGSAADRLLDAMTPVAQRVEPYRTRLVAGTRQVEPLPEGIAVPSRAIVLLEAGADHLLLLGLRENLVQGEMFPLTLRFERGAEVPVPVRVRRKVDAAGITPLSPTTAGDLSISLASAPPATPVAALRHHFRRPA